ncbi:MAG: histidinol dehydrogenase [Chitinophagaceae bacterium]|nr:histidinol dehydrogenase [Chitinophagaceae bacterium]
MKKWINPPKQEWGSLLARPGLDHTNLLQTVSNVLDAVKQEGDIALKRFTSQFDKVVLNKFYLDETELADLAKQVPENLKQAIEIAANNIRFFHEKQCSPVEKIETMPGVICWRKSVGIDKVGLYIPGGSAPLFSTILMLGIPAAIAGCKEIVLCTPPDQNGTVNPAIAFAALTVGIRKVYTIGGVQAIAAMAFGTSTIPAVYKIFGPGNQYVTLAKQLVQQYGVAIDMPAGPSEVCVLADNTAIPEFIAADLLSQAEHGADSQVLLVTTEESIVDKVIGCLSDQLATLPRADIARAALLNSKAIVVDTIENALAVVNEYAAEHLIIACHDAEAIASNITNAGSVFLGNYSPESIGDYASGTNHTLPTNGFARAYSGVSVDSFVKKITYQQLSETGLRHIGKAVMEMAKAEGLEAHSKAVELRIKN